MSVLPPSDRDRLTVNRITGPGDMSAVRAAIVAMTALRIGEDQVEAACAACDFQAVAGDQPDPGGPAVLRGECRGRGVDLDGDDFDVVAALQAVGDPCCACPGAEFEHAGLLVTRRGFRWLLRRQAGWRNRGHGRSGPAEL